MQEYCTTIGFPGLEEIRFDAGLRPRIRQNGKDYTFDELSPGACICCASSRSATPRPCK